MAAHKHLFVKGKGDLGRTDIVQHQIHTGDQPAVKQRVRRYPAARREEEQQLVEDMLAIGIIQESNSAWSSTTVLVKKKDGTTLESVLDRLGEAGLKLKAKKCQLFQEEIPFLSHIVSAAGIGADPAKCQQVRDWPVPRDLHEVRSFVGLCSYYRRHIQGFTELAAPLYELATKGTDFEWTERRHEAFAQLKNALTNAPILRFPREEGLWYLDTDASDVGTGAVLSQIEDEEEHVIAYVSKSLEGSEQRYCTARKELLAVVRALKHFKCYLYGQKITVRTNNSAVSWLYRSKDPVGQPARWIEVIDTYDITFQHRQGRKHGNADALSRYPCRQCGGGTVRPQLKQYER